MSGDRTSRQRVKEALLFGILSLAPLAVLKLTATALSRPPPMTITITFTDGSQIVYTGCSDYSNDGKIVRFKVGDELHEINWASVQQIVIAKP